MIWIAAIRAGRTSDLNVITLKDPVIRFDQGLLEIRNPDLFHSGRQRLAENLVRALLEGRQVESVYMDLNAGFCRVHFSSTSVNAVQAASLFVSALASSRNRQHSGKSSSCPLRCRKWTQLAGYQEEGHTTLFKLDSHQEGLLRFRLLGRKPRQYSWEHIVDGVGALSGVESVQVRRWPSLGLDVEYDTQALTQDRLVAAIAGVFSAHPLPVSLQPLGDTHFVVKGPRRLLYLVAGTGSLALGVVGLIVPGIPTVPFLLASSYYLARSSRELHGRLMESAFLGRILSEWESFKGMSRASKRKLVSVTVIVILLTVILAPVGPLIVVVMIATALLTLYGISRIPLIPEGRKLPAMS
jgi:uncharacterized membrane protein YbaN (DUF454 family)